ncbi:hypothetical protein BpHYR1_045948 [Brachionus plicatilis]|uniref:Uncharacterized protein n=1 Tax=Brachionus plicatilis TaxID=10195 RepID=A0A3M7T6R9_BRAPC|nr:hypothetical protein BpHYR1_045948 [Brachionus plicatilis]
MINKNADISLLNKNLELFNLNLNPNFILRCQLSRLFGSNASFNLNLQTIIKINSYIKYGFTTRHTNR